MGRRLVNLLRLAQRTINKTKINGDDGRTWGVGREFECHVHHETRFKKKGHVPDANNLIKHSPWVPAYCEELRTRHARSHTKTKHPAVPKGGGALQGSDWVGNRLAFSPILLLIARLLEPQCRFWGQATQTPSTLSPIVPETRLQS